MSGPSAEGSAAASTAAARAIFSAIQGARRVLVTSEPYPDGDAFGAEIALDHIARHAFSRPGGAGPAGRITLVNEKGCPRKYAFLSGSEKIRRIDDLLGDEKEFDVGIVVDGGIERAGAARALFDRCRTRIYIDHHRMGSRETYDLVLSDPRAPSTTQLLYGGFFADPEIATPLAKEAAEAIYLGLIYDTGSFQYPLTRPSTHVVAARLMETGIDFARIHEKALLTQEFEDVLLFAKVLASAERAGPGREVVHAAVPRALAQSPGTTGDGYDRLIQTLCFLEGVDVAVVFRELGDGGWKLSLRSRGLVDVASIARALDHDGGGHDRAAGCSLAGPLESARARALSLIEERVATAKAQRPS